MKVLIISVGNLKAIQPIDHNKMGHKDLKYEPLFKYKCIQGTYKTDFYENIIHKNRPIHVTVLLQ